MQNVISEKLDGSVVFVGNIGKENETHGHWLKALSERSTLIEVICPFISKDGAEFLISALKYGKRVKLFVDFRPSPIVKGLLQIDALIELKTAGADIFRIVPLEGSVHAKVYFFDRRIAVISSANLTRNGLFRNLEIGVVIDFNKRDSSFSGKKETESRLQAFFDLWKFCTAGAEEVSQSDFEMGKKWNEEGEAIRVQMKHLEAKISELQDFDPMITYAPLSKRIERSNWSSSLQARSVFQGFREEMWDVFEHSHLELNDENLKIYRTNIAETFNPALMTLYTALTNEGAFGSLSSKFNANLSEYRQRTSSFKPRKYLILTKADTNHRSSKHIGLPGLIVAAGQGSEGLNLEGSERNSRALEVMVGVEEDYLKELSVCGERMLKSFLSDVETVTNKLNSLGGRFWLRHGTGENRETIALGLLEKERLRAVFAGYLSSKMPADMFVGRSFFWNIQEDKKVLQSSSLPAVVCGEFQVLSWIFNEAHGT